MRRNQQDKGAIMDKGGFLILGSIIGLAGAASWFLVEAWSLLVGRADQVWLIWLVWPTLIICLVLGHGLMVAAGDADQGHPGHEGLDKIKKVKSRGSII